MLNYNKVILAGHVTADLLIKPVGTSNVVNFTIASNFKRRKQDGTYLEEACFLDVEAWGAKADIASKYLKKGDPVMVEGRLKQSNWEDKNGNSRSKISLVCEEILLVKSKENSANDTSVKDSNIQPSQSTHPSQPQPVKQAKTIAMIKGAGFEITKQEVRRIDDPPIKNKETIEDLPF